MSNNICGMWVAKEDTNGAYECNEPAKYIFMNNYFIPPMANNLCENCKIILEKINHFVFQPNELIEIDKIKH